MGISGEPCSSGTVPTSLGSRARSPAGAGLAGGGGSGYQVVSGGLGQCPALRVSSPSVFHVLRNYCLPGFYQDNIECPYFTSEMISLGIQLGRGDLNPQAE